MTSQTIPVEPFDFIIFGGTGDLAERKLLPALYQRQRAGQFSEPTRIIGASRSELSDEEYRDFARKAITEHVKAYEIDVDTKNGVVTLTGTVKTRAERERALLLARETEGVRNVIDNLKVER